MSGIHQTYLPPQQSLDTSIVVIQHTAGGNGDVSEIKLGACTVTYHVVDARPQQLVAMLVDVLVVTQPTSWSTSKLLQHVVALKLQSHRVRHTSDSTGYAVRECRYLTEIFPLVSPNK
jgi:hypothetical protein